MADALTDLSKDAKGAADALGKLGDAAKKAQPALKGAGDDASKLADKVDDAGEKAEDAAKKTAVLTTALGNLASNGIERAGEALVEWAGSLVEGASRSEAHARALEQLGGAYAAVQQATNGAVSAEQAAAVQQRALQSGLRLSAQELAAVTARAREFARSTGTDLNQALEQLTDQLVDPGEELRKFGVFLQTGMNAGDALRETLRQLTSQSAAAATSQASLAEAQEMASRATREAADSVSALLAEQIGLREFFVQYASWLNDAKDATSGWDEAITAVMGTLREMIGLQSQASAAAQQRGQSASGAFTGEAGALMQQARRRGLGFGGFEIGHLGVDATPDQRNRVLAMLRRAAQGGLNQQMLDLELQGFSAEVDVTATVRERDAQAAAAAAQRERRREIARRNQASQTPPTPIDTTGAAFAQLRSDPAGAAAWGQMYARERERAEQERGGPIAQQLQGIGLQRESSEATAALDVAGQSRGGFMSGMFSADAGRRETQQRAERIRVIREQREALAALLVEAQREEATARAMGRPVAEVNDLIRQRIGIQTALAQSTRDLVASQEEQVSGFSMVGEKLLGVLDGVAEGIGESIVAALEGSKSFGEAMEEMARATLRAVAKMAIVEALKNGAMAIAAAATYRYDAAVQHSIAAGMWVGVGVAAGAGVAAMGTGQPAPSGGRAAQAEGSGRAARADERGGGGPLVLNINVSGAAFTDAGVQAAVGGAFREAIGNGYVTSRDLAGLLGN